MLSIIICVCGVCWMCGDEVWVRGIVCRFVWKVREMDGGEKG